ncbi:MAG: PaaI family thioesterase [Pyrinomonadaceae bacterium]
MLNFSHADNFVKFVKMSAPEISEKDKERAFDALKKLPFARLIGMELVDIRKGEADVKIAMRDDLRQPYGILHGGVTATLIDTAMAFAIRTYLEDHEVTTSVDLTVHYLRPHSEGDAVCTAKVVRPGKRVFTVSADVVNNEGKLIAPGLSTYLKVS